MRALRIATRSSPLSLAQTEEVASLLRRFADVELVVVRSRGDVDLRTPLYEMREKGVFEREVDAAVLEGRADLAVHSAKDVPTEIPPGLVVAAIPPRRSPFDALVSRSGLGLADLPRGSRVGTSSLRRIGMLRRARPDLEVVPLRGNVDTRLRRLGEDLDAVVLAEAGLERLGFAGRWERLPLDQFVPAAGQGALMVTAREDDREVLELLSYVDDPASRAEVMAEKEFVAAIGAGCRAPVGVLARASGNELEMVAAVVPPDGSRIIYARSRGPPGDAVRRLVEEFRRSGGLDAMGAWRESRA